MTPQEIQSALARGMNFDAIMAQHAADIQREQGMDMGLSMARARTDVQNIQNQRDEGIAPPQTASPWAGTIGAESARLDPLKKALTYTPPLPSVIDPLRKESAAAIAALPDISGQLQARLAQQAMMDMPTGDVALTPSQQVRQDALMAQLQKEAQYQAAFQTQADMPSEVGRFAAAKAAIPQNIPRDIMAALQGMPPSALRDESIAAVQNLPYIAPNVPLDPNEFARFATPAGDISQSDISDFIRRAVTPSFTDQARQPIAGITTPSDFSDFEGLAVQPSATMAAGDVGRFARAAQPMPIGSDLDEVARFKRAAEPIPSQVQGEIDRFERQRQMVGQEAGQFGGLDLDKLIFGSGDPYENIFSQGLGAIGSVWERGKTGGIDQTEMAINQARMTFMSNNQALATSNPEEFTRKLIEFENAVTGYNNHKSNMIELERFKAKAQQTNAPADIAAVVEKEKEVKESKAKADANTIISDAGGVGEMLGERMEWDSPYAAQIQADMAVPPIPTPAAVTPAITPPPALPPVGTPPMGTSVIGGGGAAPALTAGTYTGTGGLQGLTPSAQLAGLGELGGVLGGRAQYVQQALTPEQQLARYSSFLPTTALTPEMEDYMQRIALPQMEAAFYAQGGDVAGSPFAPTAGSPYSAFENFMRTGSRLDPTQFREYLGEVSGALEAGDPTQRQQFLSSMYASPADQMKLLYQQMASGTSAATRGALGRMLGRQYQQQQFQDPATAFLPSALARGGIGGAFSQYVTPQGTVAAAGQPPAMPTTTGGMPPVMSTIMGGQGIIPSSNIGISGGIDPSRLADMAAEAAAGQPPAIPAIPVIPPAAISPAITTPAIAPTPTALPSLTATRKVNFADVPASATYDMTGQQYKDYLAEQRKGLIPRYDATGNIIGYDALDPDQAVVTSPTGQTMITKKALVPKPKKKKKIDKVVTPTLISQAEMLR